MSGSNAPVLALQLQLRLQARLSRLSVGGSFYLGPERGGNLAYLRKQPKCAVRRNNPCRGR